MTDGRRFLAPFVCAAISSLICYLVSAGSFEYHDFSRAILTVALALNSGLMFYSVVARRAD